MKEISEDIIKFMILKNLRQNSRERLIRISRRYKKSMQEVLEIYEGLKPLILKHTSLLNYKMFGKRYYVMIMADTCSRNFILLKNFLQSSPFTNNILLTDNGLAIDIILPKKNLKKFLEKIRNFDFHSIRYYEILEVLRQEDFHG